MARWAVWVDEGWEVEVDIGKYGSAPRGKGGKEDSLREIRVRIPRQNQHVDRLLDGLGLGQTVELAGPEAFRFSFFCLARAEHHDLIPELARKLNRQMAQPADPNDPNAVAGHGVGRDGVVDGGAGALQRRGFSGGNRVWDWVYVGLGPDVVVPEGAFVGGGVGVDVAGETHCFMAGEAVFAFSAALKETVLLVGSWLKARR
jgi:hypothetical protein